MHIDALTRDESFGSLVNHHYYGVQQSIASRLVAMVSLVNLCALHMLAMEQAIGTMEETRRLVPNGRPR